MKLSFIVLSFKIHIYKNQEMIVLYKNAKKCYQEKKLLISENIFIIIGNKLIVK